MYRIIIFFLSFFFISVGLSKKPDMYSSEHIYEKSYLADLIAEDDTLCFRENSINSKITLAVNDKNLIDSLKILVEPVIGVAQTQSDFIDYSSFTDSTGFDSITYIVYGGDNSSDTATVFIEIIPKAQSQEDFVYNTSLCGDTVMLAANSPFPGTGKWMIDIGVGTFIDDTDPNTLFVIAQGETEIDLKWVISSVYGCASSAGLEIDIVENNQITSTLSVNCPSDTMEPANQNCEFVIGDYIEALQITSNCNRPYTVRQSVPFGTISSFAQAITFYVEDGLGIDSSCVLNVLPLDTIPPVITCPASQKVVMNQNCSFRMINYEDSITVSDNCSSTFQYEQAIPVGFVISQDTTLMMTVHDEAENSVSCTILINLVDTVTPVITCPTNIVTCETQINLSSPIFSDNCDPFPSLSEKNNYLPQNTYTFPLGITTINYTIEDAFSNEATCQYTIEVKSPPRVDWGGIDEILCVESDSISLNQFLQVPADGVWIGNGIVNQFYFPEKAGLGTHTITYQRTDTNMICINDSTIVVKVEANRTENLGDNIQICGLTYELDFPNSFSDGSWTVSSLVEIEEVTAFNTTISVPFQGKYDISWAENEGDCPIIASSSIQFFEEPTLADAGDDQRLIYQFSTKLNATNPSVGSSFWEIINGNGEFEDQTSAVTNISELKIGQNILAWVTTNGPCLEEKDFVTIEVVDLLIPEGISPNGDLANEFFVIPGIENAESKNLKIYNRWGELVYEKDNYENEWSGRDKNGNPLPEDAYYYQLEVDEAELTGIVMVKR